MKKKFSILMLGSILLQQLIAPTNLIYATQTSEELTTYAQLEEQYNDENANTDIIYYESMEDDPNIPEEDLAGIAVSNSKYIPNISHYKPYNPYYSPYFNPDYRNTPIKSFYHSSSQLTGWPPRYIYTNLFSDTKELTTSDEIQRFVMYANESHKILQYRIIQNNKLIAFSRSNILYLDPAKLIPNAKIYIQALTVDGYSYPQLTNLKVRQGDWFNVSGSLSFSDMFSSFGFYIPNYIPIVGGKKLSFGLDGELSIDSVEVKLGPYDLTMDNPFEELEMPESGWDSGPIETDIEFELSGSGGYDHKEDTLTFSPVFKTTASVEQRFTYQIFPAGFPIYVQLGYYGKTIINAAADIEFENISKRWTNAPTVDLSDSYFSTTLGGIVGAGVGSPKIASLGVEGQVGLRYYQPLNWPSVYIDTNVYLKWKILWWKYSRHLYSNEAKIYPSGRSLELLFNDDEEMLFSMTELKSPKSSRNFMPILTDTQYMLDNYVYDQAKPRLLVHNNTEYAFWIDYNESYDSFPNGARLVYAYRSVGDYTWSDPIIVDDDGTNDFDYDVAISDDNKIHVIWQNATQLFDEEQTFRLDEIGNLTEINYKIIEAQQTTPINLLKSEHSSDDEQDQYEPGDMLPDFEGSKPIPDMPIPDMPIPDGPTPSVPTPNVPTPDMPTPDVPGIMPLNSEESPVIPDTSHKPGNMLPGFEERPVGPSIGNMLPDFDKSQAIPDIPVFDDSTIFEIGYETTSQGAIKLSGGNFGAIPRVTVDGNKATVTWVENTENAVFLDKGANYIMSIGIEDLVLERTPSIIHVTDMIPYGMDTEYVDGEYVILYSADTDNNIATETDREIFYVKNGEGSQITHNDYFEDLPKLVKNNGNVSAFWASMDNIYHAEDIRDIQGYHALFESPVIIDGSGFEVISDGNDMSILWKTKVMDEDAVNQEQDIMAMSVDEIEEQNLTKIMARHVENYEWTDSYTILESAEDISLISGYRIDSENMAVVYSITDTTDDESSSQLIYDTLTRKIDLKLDAVKTYESAIPGELFKLDVTVSNDGGFDIEDEIEIEIKDQSGDTIYSEELYVGNGLKIGESKTVEITDFMIPEELDDVESYHIKVSVNDDSDEFNNIKEITVGEVDLGLEIDRYIINDETVAQVRVFNNSTVRADSKIEIRTDNIDGELIGEIDVNDINIENDHYYTMNLNTLLEENNQEVPDKVHFNVVAEDIVLNNNTDFVVMNIVEADSSYEEDSVEDDSYYYEEESSEDDYNYYEEEYSNSDNDTSGEEEEIKHSEPEVKAKNNFVDLSKLIANKEIDAHLSTVGKTTTLTFNLKDQDIIGRKAKIDIEGNQLGNLVKTVLNEANKDDTNPRLVLNAAAMPTNANTVEIEMASNQLAELLDGDLGTVVEIQTEHGSIRLDYHILNELIKTTRNQKILFKITNGVDGLTSAQRAVIGSNPAYSFSVSANGQILNDFENDFGVKVKYYSMAGYNANTMQITFMDQSIKSPRIVEYTPRVDELFFETNGLSTFFIESK